MTGQRSAGNLATQPSWGTKAFVEHTMGMAVSLHVRASDPGRIDAQGDIASAVERAWAVMRRADAVFSTWNPASDVMRMRRGELTLADADPWVAEVQAVCEEATSVTGGLFTTTLTGPDGSTGWDPTGVVKGWAVEKAADVLREVPGIVFCLNAGGDMVAGVGSGRNPADLPQVWRVGIANPTDNSQIVTTLDLTSGALATSGTGERGAHIVDPRTGEPAGSGILSATVTGPDLVWADVWATVSVIDEDALVGSRMAASYAVSAIVRG